MAVASIDPQLLQLAEIVLTAEAVNSNPNLEINDIPTEFRPMFCPETLGVIARPITVKDGILKSYFPDLDGRSLLKHPKNSYIEVNDLGLFSLTAYGPALKWFFKHAGADRIMKNPALTLSLETSGERTVSYSKSRKQIHRFEDTVEALTSKINAVVEKSDEMKAAVELVIPYSPDEIEFSLNDLVYDENQISVVNKIEVSLKNQDFLKDNRIYDVGKVMLVGKPGTGKTSYALAVAKELHMPLLEVRLSMITSQYLGETAKNIDRIFTLAKRISPCILFIDEFDYIAKTRISDDNGTMKRAVNTLLKCLDYVSFIRDQVLFIGATNFAETLDEAVWRRITEVIKFEMPDLNSRREILEHIARNIAHSIKFSNVAKQTEGFSGAD
ncbi:MAG TPA: ATP-binding protein, partial [Methanocorpusculum sp.]|nr:ATP-binding protein [Methanocorpusculum sp.]